MIQNVNTVKNTAKRTKFILPHQPISQQMVTWSAKKNTRYVAKKLFFRNAKFSDGQEAQLHRTI